MTRTTLRTTLALLAAAQLAACVADDPESGTQPDYWEGVAYDSENPGAFLGGGAADGFGYEAPTDLPTLVDPEIVVSLDGLTLHVFDRATGFSEVYPVGVGVLSSQGRSITPTGRFATGPDTSDSWWYAARRTNPEYFAGLPFIRLTAVNSRGQNTYGLHGPITDELIRGFVSHGCVRMAAADVVRLFYIVRNHASTPVTIQTEVELDARGDVVDVGVPAALWPAGEEPDLDEPDGDPLPDDDTGTDVAGCADDRLESDDVTGIEPGAYRGLVLCEGDIDRYAIALDVGTRIEVRLHFVHRISDIDLTVYGPGGEVVGRSAGTTDEEVVTFESANAGDYVIDVRMYGEGASNGYSLDVALLD
jgi:hypothetical protein